MRRSGVDGLFLAEELGVGPGERLASHLLAVLGELALEVGLEAATVGQLGLRGLDGCERPRLILARGDGDELEDGLRRHRTGERVGLEGLEARVLGGLVGLAVAGVLVLLRLRDRSQLLGERLVRLDRVGLGPLRGCSRSSGGLVGLLACGCRLGVATLRGLAGAPGGVLVGAGVLAGGGLSSHDCLLHR